MSTINNVPKQKNKRAAIQIFANPESKQHFCYEKGGRKLKNEV